MSEVSREEHEALVVQVAALRDRVNRLEWQTLPIGGTMLTQERGRYVAGVNKAARSINWDILGELSTQLYRPASRYLYPVYKEPTAEEVEALKEKLRETLANTPVMPPLPPVQHYQELVFDGWPVANVVRFLLERLCIPKADWPELPGSGVYGPFVPGSAAALEDAGLPRVATGTGLQPKCRIKIVVEEE